MNKTTDKITLVQFHKPKHRPSFSPFCGKVEVFLKANNLPYENEFMSNPHKAPKNKLPFIRHHNQSIPDSDHIINYLIKEFKLGTDDHLTEVQKATNHLVEVMCNESLYWAAVYSRWVYKPGQSKTLDLVFRGAPFMVKLIVGKMVVRNMNKMLYAQGMGRHTETEIFEKGLEDLKTLHTILGNKKFIAGDKISKADFTVFSFLINAVYSDNQDPLTKYASQQESFKRYCDYFLTNYYPEKK